MRKPTAFSSISVTAVLLAWSGGALAQATDIELIQANDTARPRRAAPTEQAAPKADHPSILRLALHAHDSTRERGPQHERSQIGVRHTGASSTMGRQSEIAEHRQERRGASAGRAGGSGKGADGPG